MVICHSSSRNSMAQCRPQGRSVPGAWLFTIPSPWCLCVNTGALGWLSPCAPEEQLFTELSSHVPLCLQRLIHQPSRGVWAPRADSERGVPGSIKREIPTQGQCDVDKFQLQMFTDPSGAGSSGPLPCEVEASLRTPRRHCFVPCASTQDDSEATGAHSHRRTPRRGSEVGRKGPAPK